MGTVSAAIRNIVETMLKDKEEVGPDDRDAPIKILAQMVGANNPEIVRFLPAFYAKAFALHQSATGCTAAEALDAVLDQQGKTRRLFSYGGRFTESVENFRAGLALMDKFAAWYANLAEDHKNGSPRTKTPARSR